MTDHFPHLRLLLGFLLLLAAGIGLLRYNRNPERDDAHHSDPHQQPALTVEGVRPERVELPLLLHAHGSVAAWQEAIISAEVSGQRLVQINAQVGDAVNKGQLLAVFDRERLMADLAQTQAALAEAQANLQEAQMNAERVRQVVDDGALSAQQAGQYLTAEKTAEARMRSARALLDIQQLRLRHGQVTAIDDGIISRQSATLGAVASEGQELFRLIRQNRMEWRAEVTAAELARLSPGMSVVVDVPDIGKLTGKIRVIGPSLDDESRYALVYVDLIDAAAKKIRPGMFAQGDFRLGSRPALTIPQSALSLRDGFSYVFRITDTAEGLAEVSDTKVVTGRQSGDRVEVLEGISESDRVVRMGAAFLADGDRVRVVP
ncbi:MAG: efflux RND transporter periplasmic adaptor subunit [Methylococcaceae bacterium]|jgi:RND family efflux transporter MFP subunit